MAKQMSKKSSDQVNEVPLSETLQQAAEKFLRAVKDNEWDDGERTSSALIIVFRMDGDGGAHANALDEGLGDDYQKLMTDAALKAISGKTLFVTVE